MTQKDDSTQPSPAELEILRALWRLGPCPGKAIHTEVNADKKESRVVTTTLKLLQLMLGKKLVARDESTWPHTYRALVSQASMQRHYVTDTLKKAFEGSAQQFMMRALETDSVTSEDIQAIRNMLNKYEEQEEHNE